MSETIITHRPQRPENQKVLTGAGFQVMKAGVLARHLLSLARQGDFVKLLEYLDDLRFAEDLHKVVAAARAGALESFFTVSTVDGVFASMAEAGKAWAAAGRPQPDSGLAELRFHRWDGTTWPATKVGTLGGRD